MKEYGVDAYMGPLQIAYREFIQTSHTSDHTLHQVLSNQNHKVYVKLSVQPRSGVGMKVSIGQSHYKNLQQCLIVTKNPQ